jgi:DNA-binding SARP family transcriptional activator
VIRLRVFGSLDLAAESGGDVGLILRQPKRAALLVYLAAALPRGFHRRDALLALFWPELDTSHARDALNSALKLLRQGLGSDTVVSRGGEEVAIAANRFWTDVVAFEAALAEGTFEGALQYYRGDFLEGFHVAEAAGFEEWMEGERRRLRGAAAQAARGLADQKAGAGDLGLAVHWARRAVALAPDDEGAVRRLLELLDAAGDHAGALRTYDEFAARLRREFGAEPATETRAAIGRLRRAEGGAGRPR